jgi:hypothetical protein
VSLTEDQAPADAARLADLEPEQRAVLEKDHVVRVGDELVWVEPEGRVRRERVARLYYVRTAKGMFRWSKIDDALVEV